MEASVAVEPWTSIRRFRGAGPRVWSDPVYADRTVSVVVPAYNEEETISAVVADYRQIQEVDEVVVVDNNCRDRTAELAAAAGARVISESKPGYGAALRAGLDAASGELLVLTEADGSFRGADVPRLLAYVRTAEGSEPGADPMDPSNDVCADLVMGSRTLPALIHPEANMHGLLRLGNVAFGWGLSLLWCWQGAPRLTDVGCTARCLTKATWQAIAPGLKATGPAFAPEMICAALRAKRRVVEIPVPYLPRKGGESAHSDSFRRQAGTAWAMLKAILRNRFLEPPLDSRAHGPSY